MSDIYVFGPSEDANDYSTMGLVGALTPTSCEFSETANGDSIVTMSHPVDEYARYTALKKGNILVVPVPVRMTPEIKEGKVVTTVWTYKVKPHNQLTHKNQRTLYKKKTGSSKRKVLSQGNIVTVVDKPEGDNVRWKVKSQYGDGWIYPEGFELITEHKISDNSNSIESTQSSWTIKDQYFRIQEVKKSLDSVNVTARHITYDLLTNKTRFVSSSAITLQNALDGILSKCYAPHEFSAFTNVANEQTGLSYMLQNPIDTFLNPESGICALYGVSIIRDNYEIYFLKDPGMNRDVRIQYRKNMLGIDYTDTDEEVATRIIPIGETKDGKNLYLDSDDNTSNHYVDSPLIDTYPTIRVTELKCDNCKVGDKDQNGGTITTAIARQRMRKQAEDLIKNGCDKPKISMSVEFVNLGDTEEYNQFKGLENCFTYDYIIVQHPDLGIDVTSQIMQINWDVLVERMKSVQIGSVGKTLANTGITTWQVPSGFSGSKIASDTLGSSALKDNIISVRHMQADSINADAIQAESITSSKIKAGSITSDKIQSGVIDTESLNAITAKIDSLTADSIESDRLAAALAEFIVISAGTATFDRATIQHLVAEAMNLEYGVAGQVFIKNLAVEFAQMVSASVGELCIKASDGDYYLLDVGVDGSVTATKTTVSNSEIAAGETSSGKVILETNITAANLNTSNLLATYALINKIDAARIDVDQLFAREAVIELLRTSKIVGDKSITMIAGEIEEAKDAATSAESAVTDLSRLTDIEVIDGTFVQTTRREGEGIHIFSELKPKQDLTYGDPYLGGMGKNLMPVYNNTSTTINGITYERNKDGSVHFYGTATTRSVYQLVDYRYGFIPDAGTYTISAGTTYDDTGASMVVEYYSDGKWSGSYGTIYPNIGYRTCEFIEGKTLSVYVSVSAGYTVDLTFYPQLEKGSVATSYAPYINTPPITGWTGLNAGACEKNLCPPLSSAKVVNGVTFTPNSNGSVTISGTASAQTGVGTESFMLKAGTYTVSGAPAGGTIGAYDIYIWHIDAQKTIARSYGNTNDTFTLEEDTFVVLYIRVPAGEIDTSKVFWPQLEAGSAATDFEPYQGKTYAIKFGQTVYGGTVDWNAGKLYAEYGFYTITGADDENWREVSSGGKYYMSIGVIGAMHTNYAVDGVCSHAPSVNGVIDRTFLICSLDNGNGLQVNYPNKWGVSTLAEWTAFLAAQYAAGTPVQVSYKLTTPIEIQLTPVLIETLRGINTVWTDASGGYVEFGHDPLVNSVNALETDVQKAQSTANTAKTTADTAQAAANKAQSSADELSRLTNIETVHGTFAQVVRKEGEGIHIFSELKPKQDLTYGDPYPAGGGKNLFPAPNSDTSTTINGVTFTRKVDGTVVISGTATAVATAYLPLPKTIPAGTKFALSTNNPSKVGTNFNDSVSIRLISTKEWASTGVEYGTNSAGCFTTNASVVGTETFNGLGVQMRVASGVSITNFVIKPQIEIGSAVTTWTPCANTPQIEGRTELNAGACGKNLLLINEPTYTYVGITKTVNDDGSITLTGTATADWAASLNKKLYLPNGTYVVTGGTSKNYLNVWGVDSNGETTYLAVDKGSGATFTANSSKYTNYWIQVVIYSGTVCNDTLYPMIRSVSDSDTTFEPYQGKTYALDFGKNLFDLNSSYAASKTALDISGETVRIYTTSNATYQGLFGNIFNMRAGTTYTLSGKVTAIGSKTGYSYLCLRRTDNTIIDYTSIYIGDKTGDYHKTFTAEEDLEARVSVIITGSTASAGDMTLANIMLEIGEYVTPYVPHNAAILSVTNGMVYGGTADWNAGEMMVTHMAVDLGTLEWTYYTGDGDAHTYFSGKLSNVKPASAVNKKADIKCSALRPSSWYGVWNHDFDNSIGVIEAYGSYPVRVFTSRTTDLAEFKNLMSGVIFSYELNTPIIIQLTPVLIETLRGINTVWTDADDGQIEFGHEPIEVCDSTMPPDNPTIGRLWLDRSVTPCILRRWTGSEWETVNDVTLIEAVQDAILAKQEELAAEQAKTALYLKLDAAMKAVRIGQTGLTSEARVDAFGFGVVVANEVFSRFEANRALFGNMEMRKPSVGGLAFDVAT